MAKVVGDIAIAVGADIGPLQKDMAKGSRVVKGFGGDVTAMSKRMAKAGAVVATATAAMGVALFAAGKKAAASAVEINNLSKVSNAGTVEFQKMAAAADTVNISQEKLADILKDVNDRIGDFITTGGGPMKDFFEQIAPLVGVTADQFARLSGPEALQLYVSSLEKANLTQQEMTFFLEAMASDATALIPLLHNNGSELKRLGDEAQRSGRILDDDLIQNGVKLDKVFSDISDTVSTELTRALLENAPELEAMASIMTETLIPASIATGRVIAGLAKSMGLMNGQVAEFNKINAEINANTPNFDFKPLDIKDPLAGIPQSILDNFNQAIQMGDTALAEEIISPFKQGIGRGGAPSQKFDILELANNTRFDNPLTRSGGGGGFGGPTEEDLERLQEQFATEAEIIDEYYQSQLEKLDEFRKAKIGKDEEHNELERRIHKDHLDAKNELERRAQEHKLRMAAGIFRNISSLMRTENEKLFKIGKVAAVAGAIISTHRGITKALELPYPYNLAAAASVAAKGFASVSAIQSQTLGGGGGGAGASTGVGSAVQGQVQEQPSTLVNVTLVGSGSIDKGSVRSLINLINDEIDDGARLKGITVN